MLAVACGLGAALIFAGQNVVARYSVRASLSPHDLTALRFGLGGLVLFPVVWRHGFASLAGIGWPRGLVIAALAGAPFTLMIIGGFSFAPVAHGTVITPGVIPVAAIFLGWLVIGERLSAGRGFGLAAIVAGIALLGWDALGSGVEGTWIGDLMFVGAGLLWAGYTVAARLWAVAPVQGAAVISVLSMAYLPLYALFADSHLAQAPLWELVFQAVYQALITGVVGVIIYTRAVAGLGASRAALFAAFIPVFGILLGIPVLGEIPNLLQVSGMVVVTAGMVVAMGLGSGLRGERP
jgi:drug/metabolite transporter (DMT)-like permease